MKDPRVDLMVGDLFSISGLAAMNAGMEVYQTWLMIVRTGFPAHVLPLRVLDKGLPL
jgi:hypothetical protein